MTNILRNSAILFIVLLLSACSTVGVKMGRDFDVDGFASRVEQGVTKQIDIRAWLGEPSSVGASLATDGERLDEWVYYFAEGELSDLSMTKVKILQIKFDKQGAVRSYDWSASKQQPVN